VEAKIRVGRNPMKLAYPIRGICPNFVDSIYSIPPPMPGRLPCPNDQKMPF